MIPAGTVDFPVLIVAIFSFESGERLELNSKRLCRSLEKEEESRCLVFTILVPRAAWPS